MNTRRRVIFVRPSLSVSGADRWAVDAAIALQDRGWDVEIAVNAYHPPWTQPEVARGQVAVTALGGVPLWCTLGRLRAMSSLVNQWILLRRIRRRGLVPDLIIGDIVPQALTAMRKSFPTAAVLYYCHFPDRLGVVESRGLYGIYREAIGRQEDRAMEAAHRVLANSHYTASAVRQTFPTLAKDRLAIVHPGVRLPRLTAERDGSPTVQATAPRVFLAVARFDPRKGMDLAVDAFAGLRVRIGATEFAQCRLVLAGGFDRRLPEVRALVARLHAQVSQLGLTNQVDLRFDPSDQELAALWREAFAFIHPAPAEHFGIVLIEAMAHGLPVLAVDQGGPLEIVVNEVTGALRPPDAGAFSDVLARWTQSPGWAATLGASGRQRAESEFGIDRFAKEFAAEAECALACRLPQP